MRRMGITLILAGIVVAAAVGVLVAGLIAYVGLIAATATM
jgi:ABC-type Fe3+-siderophore transport system permease subunit